MAQVGFNLDLNNAKKFFFDRAKVQRAMDRVTRSALSKFGAFTRQTAKRSIRKARQKRVGELTREERRLWEIRKAIARRRGFKVRRPLKGSDPGEAARWRSGGSSSSNLLRSKIFFVYEPLKQSVIIGPARLATRINVPHILEHGGSAKSSSGKSFRMQPRPTMQLAFTKEIRNIDDIWRQARSRFNR